MPDLTRQKVRATFKNLIQMPGEPADGVIPLETGDGDALPLQLSTTTVKVVGNLDLTEAAISGTPRALHGSIRDPLVDVYPLLAPAALTLTLTSLSGVAVRTGTLTLTVLLNGTPVAGLTGLAVTTTPTDYSPTAPLVVALGDTLELSLAAVSAQWLTFTLAE